MLHAHRRRRGDHGAGLRRGHDRGALRNVPGGRTAVCLPRRGVLRVRRPEDMSEFPYRERLYACMHPETYKYFFQRDAVGGVWQRLEQRYGAIRRNDAFRVMEIESERFLFRST